MDSGPMAAGASGVRTAHSATQPWIMVSVHQPVAMYCAALSGEVVKADLRWWAMHRIYVISGAREHSPVRP